MKITLVKDNHGNLKPAYNSDLELLKRMEKGKPIEFSYSQKRNIGHHRKFFALLNLVFENQELFLDIKHLRREITMAAGFYDVYINHKGVKCYEPISIAFDSMDQDDFNEFYDKFLDKCVEIFNWNNKEDVIEHLEETR